jgi:HK97 family phage major capsid protein
MMAQCIAAGQRTNSAPLDIAREHEAPRVIQRSLQASIGSTGGYMIPQVMAAEIIELLLPQTVVRKATPPHNLIELHRGNLSMPRVETGAMAGYVGEGASSATVQEGFSGVNLDARKAKAIVPVSNDLLRFTDGTAGKIIIADLTRNLAVLEDVSFLRGAGTQYTPKGIRNLAATANVIGATGGSGYTIDNVMADLRDLVGVLETAYTPMRAPHWFFGQRTKNYLYDARDSVGGFLFRAEMDKGMFRGYPFSWTQSIPQNLGVGGNESEVYLVDMDEFIIGDVPEMKIEVSAEASYSPDGSTLYSAFDRDESVIRIIAEHDCNVRHDTSIAVLTGVVWGS